MPEPEGAVEKPLRLDQDVRSALLAANDGFTDTTYYSSKNFREQRDYTIADGALHVRSETKTSWADSRQEQDFVADADATRRFLRENLPFLETEGVREQAAVLRAERKAAEKAARAALAEQAVGQSARTGSEKAVETSAATAADVEEAAEVSGVPVKAIVVGGVLVALVAAIWAAPRVRKAWRAHRAARAEDTSDDAGPDTEPEA